jgi:tripartite-type tricarboxylate transporter receptor subunit TctC
MDEAALPGFYMSVWSGLWVPKATPKEIVYQLNNAVMATLADPVRASGSPTSGRTFSRASGRRLRPSAHFRRPRSRKWWPIIKQAGIKPE